MNIESLKLASNLYLLEGDSVVIAYFPLQSKAVFVTQKGKEEIKAYFLGDGKDIRITNFLKENKLDPFMLENIFPQESLYQPRELTLSLTSGCNLSCLYCYADAGKNVKTMKLEVAKAAIDIVISNLKNTDKLKIIFHGGGESLVVFPLMKKIVLYASRKWKGEKSFLLVTNGTLIDEQKAKWFKRNNFKIAISFDGPKDIQDKIRPMRCKGSSYDSCLRGMCFLQKEGVSFSIRSTLTMENISRIKEIQIVASLFDASLKVEPVTQTGRGEFNVPPIAPEEFLREYSSAKEYSKSFGHKIRTSYDRDLLPLSNYCGGNGRIMCVLPSGEISSCTRVTKESDDFSDKFFIGKIGNGKLYLYEDRLSELRNLSVSNFEQCRDCFAKWYCAGGCHHTRLSHGMIIPEQHCTIAKNMLWQNLLSRIKQSEERT